MATKGRIQLLLLLAVMVVSMASCTLAARGPPRMLATTQACKHKYGPWPSTVPKGSTAFQDGQHANMSTLLISFELKGVKGIKTQWVDFPSGKPSFTTFSHGTVTGRLKATLSWAVNNPNNAPLTQVGGSYNKYGMDSISFFDSNNNQYIWGDYDNPTSTAFFSPANRGYVVGFFGAANKTHLTQIGACMSK